MSYWKIAGLGVVFVWFMVGGITHFTNPDFFVSIMPPWIGWQLPIVYISGVFEILGAIGILIPSLRQLAGNCLILLVICVTPANVHMWAYPELFPDVSEALLSIRLVVQIILLWIIWSSTRQQAVEEASA